MLARDGAKISHFPTGGVRSKKFEQVSPKICRAGGIPLGSPFPPLAEATLLDWTISSFSLAENSFSYFISFQF